jgi:hypothetical protein
MTTRQSFPACVMLLRQAVLTPELTGREPNLETIRVLDESRAIRAPVQ